MALKQMLLLFLCCALFAAAYAQSVAWRNGRITGCVKDAATGAVLPMATVAAYKGADSAFIGALFSGNNGSFTLRRLPVDSVITVSITHVGYRRYLKKITIPAKQSELQLGDVLLSDDARLQDIVVTAEIPPLRMKGDTLEINPAAFKAGPNAVIEEVLKKVPGVVIWGDNKITVNGKEIKELLVDGKPFFGGHFTVATQNLPSDAIKKVQVYATNARRPDDKTMNLVLHADKKDGRFGKLSTAAGSAKRYEGDITWNMFKPKKQLSVGLAGNNTNKIARDLESLQRFNTYRGNISHADYQSDFGVDGSNKYYAGGVAFNSELADKRSFNVAYYGIRNIKSVTRKNAEISFVGDSLFSSQEAGTYEMNNWQHQIKGGYTWLSHKGTELKSDFTVLASRELFMDSMMGYMSSSGGLLLNRSNRYADSRLQRHSSELSTFFYNQPQQNRVTQLRASHILKISYGNADRKLLNSYEIYDSNRDSSLVEYNRLFNENDRVIDNKVNVSYNVDYMFDKVRSRLLSKMIYLNVNLLNSINHRYSKANAQVNDYDAGASAYKIGNSYLSTNNRETYLEERPGLVFSLNKTVLFSNRYSRKADLSGKLEWQYQALINQSEKAFRNFHNRYTAVLPSLDFTYQYIKAEAFSRKLSVRYATDTRMPGLNELAPLTDSTNLLLLTVGNAALKLQYQHTVAVGYEYTSLKNKSLVGGELRGNRFGNRIIANAYYNPDGRQILSFVNAANYQNATAAIYYNRPVKVNQVVLNVTTRGQLYMETGDLFINDQKSTFQNRQINIQASANLIIGNTELSMSNNLLWQRNKLRFADQQISTGFNYVAGIMIQQRWRRFTMASFTKLAMYSATQVPFLSRNIWNAMLSYRILKGEQLELKVSCNDILKQNQSIISTAYGNKVNLAEVNRLTRFVLLGISYYPRKFGHAKQK